MKRPISSLFASLLHAVAQAGRHAVRLTQPLRPHAARAWYRLRHPTRRGVLIAIAAGPCLLVAYTLILIPFTPGIRDIRRAKVDRPAQVLSADGKLLAEFRPSNREWVPLAEVSPNVVKALVATEDHRFYEHHGLDLKRTASAALHTFSGDRQGGSTLTQQLARNLYPDEIGRAPTLTRKLKEAITAFKIEALYTKPEILETYLNTVPFLYNAYGIEMAARTYFDKSADQLDVVEAATLVGMLKGNSYYNPVINPERALQRRNTVLAQMVKFGDLDASKLAALQKRPLRIDFERQTEEPGPAPHFAQQLRKWLIGWADRNDYNIYSDGLVVHTTIDSRLQTMATQALTHQANQLQGIADANWSARGGWRDSTALVQSFVRESAEYRNAVAGGEAPEAAMKRLVADRTFMQTLRATKTRVQAGFLAVDPRTGEIRAWVGSRDFTTDPFDHVQQARRQPGSTFKPFVYGAAFAKGRKPEDTIVDQAVEIPLAGGEVWRPSDDSAPTNKPMTLRDALAQSRNTVTAQLMQDVGPSRVVGLARAMGVRESKLDPVPSLALGTSPVSLKEMVSAYGTIADGGEYREPTMVTEITNAEGEVLATFSPARPERALSADDDYTLLDTLRAVINRGTGNAIRTRFGIRADVAGKTGTTQENADGWFILMQPQLVAGAWVGFNDSRVTLRSDYWGQGAHSALPIVGDVFSRALRARIIDANAKFEAPDHRHWYSDWWARASAWVKQLFAKAPEPEPKPKPVKRQASPPPAAPAAGASLPDAASDGGPLPVPVASAVLAQPEYAQPASAPRGTTIPGVPGEWNGPGGSSTPSQHPPSGMSGPNGANGTGSGA
ncbi:Penicillin-binding protein 1A [Pandoraea pulmonicola]|uniref:Penicillin-binding protein 1A n=1 Tax=Pandoraea pulmonicola TaxID=93221 RepID=A0AAJ4ZBQ9_PANPU|nr:Penicillin-binding protein 1A [Pandoraea pulmonicola]